MLPAGAGNQDHRKPNTQKHQGRREVRLGGYKKKWNPDDNQRLHQATPRRNPSSQLAEVVRHRHNHGNLCKLTRLELKAARKYNPPRCTLDFRVTKHRRH